MPFGGILLFTIRYPLLMYLGLSGKYGRLFFVVVFVVLRDAPHLVRGPAHCICKLNILCSLFPLLLSVCRVGLCQVRCSPVLWCIGVVCVFFRCRCIYCFLLLMWQVWDTSFFFLAVGWWYCLGACRETFARMSSGMVTTMVPCNFVLFSSCGRYDWLLVVCRLSVSELQVSRSEIASLHDDDRPSHSPYLSRFRHQGSGDTVDITGTVRLYCRA